MKTAVLLTGQPREIKEVWKSMKENLLDQLPNPEVFIYTSEEYDVPEFFDSIKLVKYVVEPQFKHDHIEPFLRKIGFYANHRIDPTIQQFYGIKKAWDLMADHEEKNNFKYDLVVRTRSDFIWLRPLKLDFVDLEKVNNLHASFAPTMSTEFAIGPNSEMEKYCGLYDWLANEGQNYLTNDHPRLAYPVDHKYNCDILLIAYLVDYMKVKLADQRLPADFPCPYNYYRIYKRHVLGQY